MVVLLKFSSSKLNTSKATLFTWLNKSFLSRTILTSGPGSKKHYPQQYLHDCVHCPWFWFGPIFFPYTTRAVFCSMDETLDIGLAPRFAISNSALKSNSLKKNSNYYWNLIQLKMGVVMCVSHTQCYCLQVYGGECYQGTPFPL